MEQHEDVCTIAEHLHKYQNEMAIINEEKEVLEMEISIWEKARTKAEAKIKNLQKSRQLKQREFDELDSKCQRIFKLVDDSDIVKQIENALSAQIGSAEYFEAKKRVNERLKNF
jgi:predicted  nucleic acid-binding Zn-ribbon protein